jgi:DNA replication and repair protein RecF
VRCHRLSLHLFRAHEASTFTFAPGLNLLYGPNGVGKTNVLEALHYLALTRSFVTAQDAVAIRVGHDRAEVRGDFEGARRGAFTVRLLMGGETGKTVLVNGVAPPTLSEHVGRIPLVVLAPQDAALTAGGPEERRRFLNNLIGQARPVYLDDLLRYGRALRQRTELLQSARGRRFKLSPDLLEAWTEEVATLGARVVHARARALEGFQGYLDEAHTRLGARLETPSFTYEAPVPVEREASVDDVAEALRRRFAVVAVKEQEAGRTLVGPHRDEVTFRLGTFEVRRYASQGQHRTFGVALRLAQFFFLKALTEETPLLLLDDLFASLDSARSKLLLEFLTSETVGQSFVTHPEREAVAAHVDLSGPAHSALHIGDAAAG